MSVFYGPPKSEPDMIALLRHAVDSGVTFLDTSDVYGPHTNEILIGKALKGGLRERAQVATKFGISLKRLGLDCIDLYCQHRVDARVPIEVTIGELKKLVEEGKVKHVGLSEASASTIRRAHAVHPITAVQLEWSMWSRLVEAGVIPTGRELSVGIVSYSPLGRGFFSYLPRFQPENLVHNAKLFDRLHEVAKRKGCTPSQLALAWVHHEGDDACPIPSTTKMENFNRNIGALYRSSISTWENSGTPHLSSWEAA
ncbi:hypothetical protein EUGRSUZ_H00488 [Eucalyptus grandis]|uniref:NADP-dependent oxidoreductase domain-containing protein n=2 Tax=Eucalyptus grandis TaxID=71139 RepID=A0A059AVP9_EUCGR|nr:hypothetical protein EUGRSUZ_H00488 [Eucalyptus grandis]